MFYLEGQQNTLERDVYYSHMVYDYTISIVTVAFLIAKFR